ncbi:MAG: helix-turn-helix transcriptional regulator [Acidimicrobiales bacterium]
MASGASPGDQPERVTSPVRDSRLRAGRSQQQLATELGKSKQWVAAVEAGRITPPLEQLLALFRALHPATEPIGAPTGSEHLLAQWLAAWIETHARAKPGTREDGLLEKAIGLLRQPTVAPQAHRAPWRSLDQFPAGFEPLTIVAADRRDQPPETRADVTILSGAAADLTFLMNLRHPDQEVKLRSDKLILLGTDEMRRRELGRTNLLVISSPAANWAARTINGSALFRYDVPERAQLVDARIRTLTELDDSTLLRLVWRLISAVQESQGVLDLDSIELGGLLLAQRDRLHRARELAGELLAFGSAEDILSQFSETGILDPVADRRYQMPSQSFDYAMISLAPNPYAESHDFVSILVSGMHGQGTTHAVGALVSDPDKFASHPFGGTIQVHEQMYADWAARLLTADWEWKTPGYTPDSLVERFEQALGQEGERPPGLSGLTDQHLRARIAFVRSLARSEA